MYSFYRGTPFQFAGQLQDDGVVFDLTNCTITAKVFDPMGNTVYGVLTCAIMGDPKLGLASVSYAGDTTHWPVGKARIDFLLQTPNNVEPIASDPCWFRIAQTPMIG